MSGDLLKLIVGALVALVGFFGVNKWRLERKLTKAEEKANESERRAEAAEVDGRVARDLGGTPRSVLARAVAIALKRGLFRKPDGGDG